MRLWLIVIVALFSNACSVESKEEVESADVIPIFINIEERKIPEEGPAAFNSTINLFDESIRDHSFLNASNAKPFTQKRNTSAAPQSEHAWAKIIENFEFYEQYKDHAIVTHYVYRTLARPKYFHKVLANSEPYLSFIYKQLKLRNMPTELALLPLVESGFAPRAVSNKGAAGLWQFTRSTGKYYGLKQNWWYDARLDVYQATIAALNLLQDLHYKYKDWPTALAAYNYGMGNVDRLIKVNRRKNLPTDYWSLNLPKETQEYVPKLIAYCHLLEHAKKYKLRVNHVSLEDELKPIKLSKVTSVNVLAKASGISVKKFKKLNPGFLRWAPKPSSRYTVLLPASNHKKFNANIDALIAKNPIVWGTHTVQSGENLYNIARFYGIKLRELIAANSFNSKRVIRAGDRIVIPSYKGSRVPINRKYQKGRHIVKSGDTLYDLAKYYKVRIIALARANKLRKNSVIRPGQSLIIPK